MKLSWLVLCMGCSMVLSATGMYDPMVLQPNRLIKTMELTVHDDERMRDIPILIYYDAACTNPAPVILFSHGLGGTRHANAYMGTHWANRGFIVTFIQHPGSDDSVWKNAPRLEIKQAMEKAASNENFQLRVKDAPRVIDFLTTLHQQANHPLQGRFDLAHIGMSGHSFGAKTTQAVSGESYLGGKISYTDPRIDAAIAFSPSSPRIERFTEQTFASVKIPWMLMTGTHDTSVINNTTVENRLNVFPALPAGNKYELVLNNAEHSAFTDRALPGDKHSRNPNHHRAILALSTAFWEAYLCEDASAKAWLDGEQMKSILDANDRWQKK